MEFKDEIEINFVSEDFSGISLWAGQKRAIGNLSKANLTNANLSEADLTRANLRGTNLTKTNLLNAKGFSGK